MNRWTRHAGVLIAVLIITIFLAIPSVFARVMYAAKANAMPLSLAVGVEHISNASQPLLNVALVSAVSDLGGSNRVSGDGNCGPQRILGLFARPQEPLTEILGCHGDARPQSSLSETDMPAYFEETGGRIPGINIPETAAKPGISVSSLAYIAFLKTNDSDVRPMARNKIIADGFPHSPRNYPKASSRDEQGAGESGGPPLGRPPAEKRIPLALALGLGSNFVMWWGLNLDDERRFCGAALRWLAVAMFLSGCGLMLTLGLPATWGWWV
jgi:hypothetical protein